MFRKVLIKERLPEKNKWVTTIDTEGQHIVYRLTDIGWNMRDQTREGINNNLELVYWLEEVEPGNSPGPFGLLHLGRGSFGEAVAAAKAGHKVARIGWNGAGMFAYIVPANSYPAQTEVARKTFGEVVPYRQYWALKTAQNDVATWAPSGSDSLADDWTIVE